VLPPPGESHQRACNGRCVRGRAAPRASPAAAAPTESLDRVLRDAQRLLQAGTAGEALGASLAPVRARAARLDGPDDAYRAHLLIGTRLAELCAP